MSSATLVLGGIRSGKSKFAECLIEQMGGGLYIATANIHDKEMEKRVAQHCARRGAHWDKLEVPLHIVSTIQTAKRPVLLDCITLWLSNLIEANIDIADEVTRLARILRNPPQPIVLVSNEIGLGGISINDMQRQFADLQGAANQILAQSVQHVVFIAAGFPITLKGAR